VLLILHLVFAAMGAGASAGLGESLTKASVEELRLALLDVPADQCAMLREALEGGGGEVEEVVELSFVLDQVFKCFDADQDGQIEREEFLACQEKLAEVLDESFGPKQRKVKMAWYKDAGAEGTPTDGMYLSREKWQAAFLATAATESSIPPDQETKLASWMWKSYAKKLVQSFFPDAVPAAAAASGPDRPDGPCPEYPMTIPLAEMAAKLEQAHAWGLRPLVLGSGCSEVDTYFKYKIPDNLTIDGSSLFLKKKEELKSLLKRGMEFENMCAPILIKMGGGTTDINKVCGEGFPAEVFNGAAWTPKAACAGEFISDGMLGVLDSNPNKWKDFTIITYSEFGLEDAMAKLSNNIPHFEKLAIIVIDPESVAK